ncbi:MAG: MGMT family protein [Candidatus Bilamarchaeaceae archaeon]
MATEFEKNVYSACRRIGKGRVSTYSEIAKAIGKPGACRAVGNALKKNRNANVPCHRVVRSDGRIGGFARGSREKERILGDEGIAVKKGKITNFKKSLQKFVKKTKNAHHN